jgi:6-phosphogluconolactonase
MTNKSFWPVVCLSVLMAGMLGCGSGSSSVATQPSAKPEFLYVTAATGPLTSPTFQLSAFKIDSTSGAVSATSTLPLSQIVTGIAADSSSKFLYLSSPNPLASFVGIYSIDATSGAPTSDGSLLLTSVCALCPPPSAPGALALDPAGSLLYYGSSSLGIGVVQGIGALTLDSSTGGLTPVSGSPFPAEQAPFLVAVHPSGQFVYTANASGIGLVGLALDNISAFSVGSGTGTLTPVQGSPFTPPVAGDVAGFAMHPSGKFLYATTGRAANGILAWSIDATTGELTNLPGSPCQPGIASFGGAFDPAGKFFYVSAGGDGGIYGFNVDNNSGALTPLASSPFASGSVMSDPAIDPSGKFLFTVDALTSAITGFSVDATTGALTDLGSPAMLNAQAGLLTIVKAP